MGHCFISQFYSGFLRENITIISISHPKDHQQFFSKVRYPFSGPKVSTPILDLICFLIFCHQSFQTLFSTGKASKNMTAYKSQPRVRVSFRGMSFVDYHVNLVTLHTYYKLQKLILRLDLMSVKWDKGQSVFMIPLNCIKMWLISARNIN